jgi:hypothetical protein
MSDIGDPFDGLEDSYPDDIKNFNFDDEDDWTVSDDDKFMADQIDQVGEKTANAIAYATGRSAEYIVASNRQGIASLQKHNEYLVGKINVGIGALNSSIASVIDFNDKVMKVHVENSRKFFETSNTLDKERNDILKKLLENQTNLYKSTLQEQKKSETIKYNDIVGANGMPDLKLYGKKVMQNLNSMTGGYADMNNMFEGGNMLLAFAGSPLKFITDTIIKKMTPKVIENSMKDLNETLSGLFGSIMSKFSDMKNDEEGNIIFKKIGELFGLNTSLNKKIDTSKYNRGAIPFDGETKMAITQVIPMHLAKIESALTGQTERMFDYKKGSFANLDSIKKDYENISKSYSDKASS